MPRPITRPIARAVDVLFDGGGQMIVELRPDGVSIRRKGTHKRNATVVSFLDLASFDGVHALDVETRHYQLRARVTPHGVAYRERGSRKEFVLPHGVAFQRAVDNTVRAEKAEKKQKRKLNSGL
jgi:hypothetical protein